MSMAFGIFSVGLLTNARDDQTSGNMIRKRTYIQTANESFQFKDQKSSGSTFSARDLEDYDDDHFESYSYSTPTAKPTKKPTRFPTKSPTKKPTRTPTAAPTKSPILFNGIGSVYSFKKGEINVSWSPLMPDDSQEDKVEYDIFIADGIVDFQTYPKKNPSLDDLKEDSDIKHYQVEGDRDLFPYNKKITFSSEDYGKDKTVQIFARLKDEEAVTQYNKEGLEVRISGLDPHVRDSVNLATFYAPSTKNTWKMRVNADTTADEELDGELDDVSTHTLIFEGEGIPEEAQNLSPGWFISGAERDYGAFVLRITEVIESRSGYFEYRATDDSELEEIMDSLDINGYFDSANDKIVTPAKGSSSSASQRRFLSNERYLSDNNRRLQDSFWDQAWKSFVGEIEDVKGDITEFIDELFSVQKKFEIGVLNQAIDNVPITQDANLSGVMDFQIKLKLDIKISGIAPELVLAGIKADYIVRAVLDLSEKGENNEPINLIPLFQGQQKQKSIMVGFIPIIFTWTPRFDLIPLIEGTWESGEMQVRLQGTMKCFVDYNDARDDNKLTGKFNQKTTSDPLTSNDGSDANLNLNAGLKFATDFGVYGGLVGADAGFITQIGVDIDEKDPEFSAKFILENNANALYGLVPDRVDRLIIEEIKLN